MHFVSNRNLQNKMGQFAVTLTGVLAYICNNFFHTKILRLMRNIYISRGPT